MTDTTDLTAYGRYLSAVAGLHPDTVAYHLQHVQRFLAFAEQKAWQLDRLPEKFMEDFIRESDALPTVRSKILWSMQRYCDYLLDREELSANPFREQPRQSRKKKVQHYWTPAEIERLLAAIDSTTIIGLRNRTLVEILYDTGIRNHEVRKLVLPDLNMKERYMLIRGKRYKERLIPLNDGAMYWLEQYLPRRHELFVDKITPVLFPSSSTGEMMCSKSIWSIVKHPAQAAGLDTSFNVHSLRYAFASHMLTNGADLRVVQELLGHSDISTTGLYAQLEAQHLKELHRRYHPRADFPEEAKEAGEGKESQ